MLKKKMIIFLMLLGLFFGNSVYADPGTNGGQPITGTVPAPAGATTRPAPASGGTVSLTNPLGDSNVNLYTLLGTIINAILGFVGALAFAMFIWGGLQLMTARGNDKQVTAGKDTLKWAAVGLVIIFSSYAAVKLIMDLLLPPPVR